MRKLIIISTLVLFSVISYQAEATDVGGIINSDTTWTLANSPYYLTSTVQVAEGVTLTIEPAVVIDFTGGYGSIEVWGTLKAIGTEQNIVSFNCTTITNKSHTSSSDFNYCFFKYRGPRIVSGSVIIKNCVVDDGSISISTPDSDSIITDNYFLNSSNVGLDAWNKTIIYVEHNVFVDTYLGAALGLNSTDSQIMVINNYFSNCREALFIGNINSASSVIIHSNSFLDNTIAICLTDHTNANIDASYNYWNTTDISIIDNMIYDRKDDLDVPAFLTYTPFLIESDPNTPIYYHNQILTIQSDPSDANTLTPRVGQHVVSGSVDISADKYINCPNVYLFDHWEGDVADPNSASTTVFMDSDKTIKAVFTPIRECGDECHSGDLFGDYNHDCIINIIDLSEFARNWLLCTKPECD